MLEKSKIRYFSHYFLLLPSVVGAVYVLIQLAVDLILSDSNYWNLFTLISCCCLSFATLIFVTVFNKKSDFVKGVSSYVIILYVSCLISFILNFIRYNFGLSKHCAFNYDISFLLNVYIFAIILTTISNVIFFYVIVRLNLTFKWLYLLILLAAMIVQYFVTHSFRMI